MADSETGIPFGHTLVPNLRQGYGALIQAHTISLHHLHDPSNKSVNAGCANIVCTDIIQISSVILSLGESSCCLVVVHDRFVNCCFAMLFSGVTGLDQIQGDLCFPDISLVRFIPPVVCSYLVNVVWMILSEVMPAYNGLTRRITC